MTQIENVYYTLLYNDTVIVPKSMKNVGALSLTFCKRHAMSIGQLCQADDFHSGAKKFVKLSPMERDSWLIVLANNVDKIASPGFWKCWDIGVMKMVIFAN